MTAYLLNLFDLGLTLHALRHGAAELNPVMQCVPFQIAYKVFVVGALCYWLGKRKEPIAKVGMYFLTAVFAAVDVWHIVNII